MKAIEVFTQQNGAITTAYYEDMKKLGPLGEIAVCLFRAAKRSSRAKDYKRGKFRRAAYDVKTWSLQELCKSLTKHAATYEIRWGWKSDPKVLFGERASWILYADLPTGQCSFHNPERFEGPEYKGEWSGLPNSADVIIRFCDRVASGALEAV
jgi:hypothetical protein